MTEGLLPLFPLETVLFPGQKMALHIFEERYREMVGECLERSRGFGIVRAAGRGIARKGCGASVARVLSRYEDGRLDIVARGEQRFEILELNDERSFLRARVQYYGDEAETEATAQVVEEAQAAWRVLNALKGGEGEEEPRASFEMAMLCEDLDFRQGVLEMRSEAERMEVVLRQLRREADRERVKLEMQKVVRLNGHGKHLDGLG